MKKNKRRVSVLVTAQTLWNLENLARSTGYGKDIGKVIDKLTREKMLHLKAPSVDSVSVVQCWECRQYNRETMRCKFWPDEGYRDPYHFCGEGDRRAAGE